MAIGNRDDIVVKYGADDSKLQKVTKRVSKTASDLSGSFGKLGNTINGAFSSFKGGAVAGISAVVSGLTVLAKSSLETADNIAKTAAKIGVTTDELQEFRHAASTVGVEQGQLDTSLQRFSRRVGEAAQGTGVLNKEFERLGIRLRNNDGTMRSVTDILGDYSDAVKNANSAQEQLRLTVAGFDTEGAGMVNILRLGKEEMFLITGAAQGLGKVLDKELIDKAEIVNQRWDDLFSKISTGFKRVTLQAVDFIDTLINGPSSLDAVTKQLEENYINLAIAEEKLEKATGRARNAIIKRRNVMREEILDLEKRKIALEGNIDVEKELEKQRAKQSTKTSEQLSKPKAPTTATSGTAASAITAASQPKSSLIVDESRTGKAGEVFAQGVEEPFVRFPGYKFLSDQEVLDLESGVNAGAISRSPRADPVATANALADFRAGRISSTELGIRTGLKSPDTPEPKPGAFGTPGNLTAPPPSTAGIETTDQPLRPSPVGGSIQPTPSVGVSIDPIFIQEQVAEALNGRIYQIQVAPNLVGVDGLQDDVDKTGTNAQ